MVTLSSGRSIKFDVEGVAEVQRKFFGTLYNTYSFFTLYANIDNFDNSLDQIKYKNRPEIDCWIISELNCNEFTVYGHVLWHLLFPLGFYQLVLKYDEKITELRQILY